MVKWLLVAPPACSVDVIIYPSKIHWPDAVTTCRVCWYVLLIMVIMAMYVSVVFKDTFI